MKILINYVIWRMDFQRNKSIAFILFLFLGNLLFAQPIQNIRGKVVDNQTHLPIEMVEILLVQEGKVVLNTQTDVKGTYLFKGVKVGRYSIITQLFGYKKNGSEIILGSGREWIQDFEMEELTFTKQEVTIQANPKNGGGNEMMLQSTKNFNPDEAERFAGSRADPARMASNFAGVQGNNDSRNDVVIRGNSPFGVFNLFENVNIPSPNHFAIAGTGGGPVSILNNKVLTNSTFMTGAFPAEFGNSASGGFDFKMRAGNNKKTEFSGQFGFLGTEILLEGPFVRSKSASYLISYRYSTLKLFDKLKIKIGTDAVPNYFDGGIKLNFPLNDKVGVSFFAIGGSSNIDIVNSNKTTPPTDIYSEATKDQYFGSNMLVFGSNLGYTFSKSSYLKLTVAHSIEQSNANHDFIKRDSAYRLINLQPVLNYDFNIKKTSFNFSINTKLTKGFSLKYGCFSDIYNFNFSDSFIPYKDSIWQNRWGIRSKTSILVQPYFQMKKQFSESFEMVAGLHSIYFQLTEQILIEPRLSLRKTLPDGLAFTFASGLHSQTQPYYTYFYQNRTGISKSTPYNFYNQKLGATRSLHIIGGVQKAISKVFKASSEIYFQYLFDVPVDTFNTAFSMVNNGSSFSRIFPNKLTNQGTGKNYGFEITLEKTFSHHYFLMLTGSIFNSLYKGSDGKERNTDFNGNFATNLLGGYEIKTKKWSYNIGGKFTYAGGRRYSDIDYSRTNSVGEIIYSDVNRNNKQFKNYFRADIKLNGRLNTQNITHEIGLDLVNVFNTKNYLGFTFNPGATNPIRTDYQLGFLPLFYYKIEL